MFKIAICSCPNSRKIIERKISNFLQTSSMSYQVSEFTAVKDLVKTGVCFDAYFLNRNLRNDVEILLKYIENNDKNSANSKAKKHSFVTYVDDPVPDDDCDMLIDCIQRYLDYDSMYFAVEFLTDKGLRSIAISKILFFEFVGRKIRIKAQNNEFLCNDSLRNVLSLVNSFDFHQPHKGFIVNLKHITSIKNYVITMNDGSLIPLSQKKSKDFRAIYKAYVSRRSVERNRDLRKKARCF